MNWDALEKLAEDSTGSEETVYAQNMILIEQGKQLERIADALKALASTYSVKR